jgi:hypothetical protein
MSDYLTRLVERSLGLAPRIEPLIAPINAPSDQVLNQAAATSATFEPDTPAGRIETSPHDTPANVALKATGVEANSQTGTQFPQASSPLSESQMEVRVEKSDNRIHSTEMRASAPSQNTSSTPSAEAVGITPTTPPTPRETPIISQGTPPNILQPEIIEYSEPGASPKEARDKNQLIVRPEIVQPAITEHLEAAASPKDSSLLPRVITASKKTTKTVVQPEITGPLQPAASSMTPALESSEADPLVLPSTTTASKRPNKINFRPETIGPRPSAASPFVPARPQLSNEPPVIHVTIGRVEVRAIMPPATPKVAPPAAPKLSLEEYLKQRNGRAR